MYVMLPLIKIVVDNITRCKYTELSIPFMSGTGTDFIFGAFQIFTYRLHNIFRAGQQFTQSCMQKHSCTGLAETHHSATGTV